MPTSFKYLSKDTADALAHAIQLFAEDLLKTIAGNAAREPQGVAPSEKVTSSHKVFWSAEEVAAFCGVKPRTVHSWVTDASRTGIPFSRPKGTRRLRFEAAAIMAWAKNSELLPHKK